MGDSQVKTIVQHAEENAEETELGKLQGAWHIIMYLCMYLVYCVTRLGCDCSCRNNERSGSMHGAN